jgi:hypothetical protein
MVLRSWPRHTPGWGLPHQGGRPLPQAGQPALHASAARRRATPPEAPARRVHGTGGAGGAVPRWPLAQPQSPPHGRQRSKA